MHLIAFIAHQYYRLQDNFVDILLNSVKNTENTVNRKRKDWYYENRDVSNKIIIDTIDQIKLNISNIFAAISCSGLISKSGWLAFISNNRLKLTDFENPFRLTLIDHEIAVTQIN